MPRTGKNWWQTSSRNAPPLFLNISRKYWSMSQIFNKKTNSILPESRSPFPFAGPVFFSRDEDEFCILETSKCFSTLTRMSPLPLVHPAASYLQTTKTKTSEYFNQINHINSLCSPNLAEPEQSGHQLIATQRGSRLETPESGRMAGSTSLQSVSRKLAIF